MTIFVSYHAYKLQNCGIILPHLKNCWNTMKIFNWILFKDNSFIQLQLYTTSWYILAHMILLIIGLHTSEFTQSLQFNWNKCNSNILPKESFMDNSKLVWNWIRLLFSTTMEGDSISCKTNIKIENFPKVHKGSLLVRIQVWCFNLRNAFH